MIIFNVFVLIGLCLLSQSLTQNRFMPNLPLGEYNVAFDKIYRCETAKNHSLLVNLYFSKTTLSLTEVKGNFTALIPFDNTLTYDMSFSSWGSTGGWTPNAFYYTSKNTCSSIKTIFGNAWFTIIKHFNVPTDSCPVPAGVYQTTGVDLKKFEDQNWPKVYFYGKYKVFFRIRNAENNVVGCVVVEFTLLRPWEKPI